MAWRTLDLGGSAAIAYMLLFVVTIFCHGLREPDPAPGARRHGAARADRNSPRTAPRGSLLRNPFRRRNALECRPRRSLLSFLLLLLWAFVVLFPLYWLLVTSVKLPMQVDGGPFYLPFIDFQPYAGRLALHPRRAAERHAAPVREHGDRGA